MEYTGKDLVIARVRFGQTQPEAARDIGVSVNTIVDFEKRDALPKSPVLQKAIEHYIDENLNKEQ